MAFLGTLLSSYIRRLYFSTEVRNAYPKKIILTYWRHPLIIVFYEFINAILNFSSTCSLFIIIDNVIKVENVTGGRNKQNFKLFGSDKERERVGVLFEMATGEFTMGLSYCKEVGDDYCIFHREIIVH